jgi:iron complex transport system substrate-binding protein
MKIQNDLIDAIVDIPEDPHRIVSLSSGFTESLYRMGCADRVVGVSAYCSRYVDVADRPVIGDYLTVDRSRLDAIEPDLIVLTGGVQRTLALKLRDDGYPVYALPLPESFAGVCDAAIRLGALTGDVTRGRDLAWSMMTEAAAIRSAWTGPVPKVYVELWFGRHVRTIGGRTFIHDTVEIAGGCPVFGSHPGSYVGLDIDAIDDACPDIILGFSEPEFPVDFRIEVEKRHWSEWPRTPRIVVSDVRRGRNVIHDGPSMIETARWLQEEMLAAVG